MKKIIVIFATALLVITALLWKKTSTSSNTFASDSKSASSKKNTSSITSFTSDQRAEASTSSSPLLAQKRFSYTPASNLPTGTGAAATTEIGGMSAQATVLVKGKKINLTPDEIGFFPRILLGVNEKVKVVVSYPEGSPEDPLVIQAEDGGHVNQSQIVTHGKLDTSRQISFDFETGENDGIYRVTVRKGFDEKRLDFWVGPELQTAKGS